MTDLRESKNGTSSPTGRKRRGEIPRQIASIAIAGIIALAARSTLADHYIVPSGSMLPTVQEGDRIVVNKLAYGLRIPFTQVFVYESDSPHVGEVVVLVSPEGGHTLLKRITAGPGDRIEVRDGHLLLNGEEVPIELVGESLMELLGERSHEISLSRGGGPDYGPLTIPPDQFLVMGDNRGDSRDGRIFGLVPRSAILGRAWGLWLREGSFTWRAL